MADFTDTGSVESNNPVRQGFDSLIKQILHSFRVRMDMEVAFISHFINDYRLFKYIDNAKGVDIIQVGGGDPLSESYCQRIIDGRLPELIQDAQLLAAAQELAATRLVPVGAHISVPIYLSDGQLFGTYCAFCRYARQDLNEKDLALIRMFADITASLIENNHKALAELETKRVQIQNMIDRSEYYVVFQPIFNLKNSKILGYEALTRFNNLSTAPDKVFEQADELGLGIQLGRRTMIQALEDSKYLPKSMMINLNATPKLILSGALDEIFSTHTDLSRYVLEITEHVIVDDYQQILQAIASLRKKGIRLAVDDAGAGYASFRHILLLKPDIIKLDTSLIRDIDKSDEKQALTTALVAFSKRGKQLLIAEGVETEEELAVLRSLKVDLVQGFLFSKALPINDFFTQSNLG